MSLEVNNLFSDPAEPASNLWRISVTWSATGMRRARVAVCSLLRRDWNVSQKIKCFKWLSHDSIMNLICDGWGAHRDIPGWCWFLLPITVILHGVDWVPAVPYGSLHQVPDYSLTICSWETLILWKPLWFTYDEQWFLSLFLQRSHVKSLGK